MWSRRQREWELCLLFLLMIQSSRCVGRAAPISRLEPLALQLLPCPPCPPAQLSVSVSAPLYSALAAAGLRGKA